MLIYNVHLYVNIQISRYVTCNLIYMYSVDYTMYRNMYKNVFVVLLHVYVCPTLVGIHIMFGLLVCLFISMSAYYTFVSTTFIETTASISRVRNSSMPASLRLAIFWQGWLILAKIYVDIQ